VLDSDFRRRSKTHSSESADSIFDVSVEWLLVLALVKAIMPKTVTGAIERLTERLMYRILTVRWKVREFPDLDGKFDLLACNASGKWAGTARSDARWM
jgi:hypothetical protein